MLHKLEKKELVIICNKCYPIPSATGLLALNCAKQIKNDFNIRIITFQDGKETSNIEREDYTLFTVSNWRLNLFYKLQGKIYTKKGKKTYCKLIYNFVRLLGKIDRTFFHIDSYKWFERKAYATLKKLNRQKKIDVLLSVSEPMRAHKAAERFKKNNPNIHWVCYWGDLYATKYFKSNIFSSLKTMKNIEKQITKKADYILCNEEIYEHYKKLCDLSKISFVPYTLKNEILELATNKSMLSPIRKFVYYGSFSANMRNPEKMLELFLRSHYELALYSNGCEDIVQKYVEASNGRIRSYGFVEQTILRKRVLEADAIINLGNADADFIPSKTLEILSYRKPVVDFYYGNNEFSPISCYPLLFRVPYDSNIECVLTSLEKFLSNSTVSITPEKLREIFANHTEEKAGLIIREAIFKNG